VERERTGQGLATIIQPVSGLVLGHDPDADSTVRTRTALHCTSLHRTILHRTITIRTHMLCCTVQHTTHHPACGGGGLFWAMALMLTPWCGPTERGSGRSFPHELRSHPPLHNTTLFCLYGRTVQRQVTIVQAATTTTPATDSHTVMACCRDHAHSHTRARFHTTCRPRRPSKATHSYCCPRPAPYVHTCEELWNTGRSSS
jgi:hypothetical protein